MTDFPAPRLVVGLGNPGVDYANTRHNVGFWFLDSLAHQFKFSLNPEGKFFGRAGRSADCWFLQPTCWMNCSGQAVQALAGFYKILPQEILVAHDDLDLPPGSIRLKLGGGNGGHNGLRDIQSKIGSADFWRLRLGIGHPRSLGLPHSVVDFVLHPPRLEEKIAIDIALQDCLSAWKSMSVGDYAAAQRQLHRSPEKKQEILKGKE